MAQLGRIAGHLLQDNLVREGIDLAFKNTSFDADPILFLDINNGRVGFKTDSPVYDLDIRTNLSTTNLGATSQAEIDQVYINAAGFITSGTGPINISPQGENPLIILERLISDNLQITDNKISSFANSNIVFDPNGSGTVELQTNVNIQGDLETTGDINISGDLSTPQNIIIGDSPLDVVRITPELEQGLTTGADLTYNLGSQDKQWGAIYSPDMTNIANVNPDRARISSQLLIDGVTGDINQLQSNDNTILKPNSGVYNSFELATTLDNPNLYSTTQFDRFGFNVGMSDSYTIISAPREDDSTGLDQGKVYIFNNSNGSLAHTLDNPNTSGTPSNDEFGFKVAISESYAIVSAPFESSNSGVAYIFDTDTGNLLHTLVNPNAYDAATGDEFGRFGLAINETYCAISSVPENNLSGVVYVFDNLTGALVYTIDNPNAFDTEVNDRFGISLDLNSTHLIVGAFLEDQDGFTDTGKAYIFDLSDGSLYLTVDNADDVFGIDNDRFGNSVSISENYFAIGSYTADTETNTETGVAYIYSFPKGELINTLQNPNNFGTADNDRFGEEIIVTDEYTMVSSIQEDDATGTDVGIVYIFHTITGQLIKTIENENAFGTTNQDYFGFSIGACSTNLVVGAWREDDAGGNQSGKAYLYTVKIPKVEIEDLTFDIENTVIYNNLNSPVQLRNTGIGYVRFSDTNGIVLPSGPNADRPATPEVGDTRWNTEELYLECFDGTVYITSIGPGDPVTQDDMDELGVLYSLFLG